MILDGVRHHILAQPRYPVLAAMDSLLIQLNPGLPGTVGLPGCSMNPLDLSEQFSAWEWKHKDGRIKANCAACHPDTKQGERQMNGRFRTGSDTPSQNE